MIDNSEVSQDVFFRQFLPFVRLRVESDVAAEFKSAHCNIGDVLLDEVGFNIQRAWRKAVEAQNNSPTRRHIVNNSIRRR